MPSETVKYRRDGRVAYITLNRPRVLNAVNKALEDDLARALNRFDLDDEAWVAIIHGEGRAFQPAKPGRGNDKLPVLGAVERNGRVVAQPSIKVDARAISDFLNRHVDQDASLLITDAYPTYRPMRRYIRHAIVDQSQQYVDGLVHTNTIEGFWSLLKRTWYGSHHHYSKLHAFAYVVEAAFKYNIRKVADLFNAFIRSTVAVTA